MIFKTTFLILVKIIVEIMFIIGTIICSNIALFYLIFVNINWSLKDYPPDKGFPPLNAQHMPRLWLRQQFRDRALRQTQNKLPEKLQICKF